MSGTEGRSIAINFAKRKDFVGKFASRFTATLKTILEDFHIPLHKWLLAIPLANFQQKGISAYQFMRNLDTKQYKSACFMAHRIRYVLTGKLSEQMTGVFELDQTYIGGRGHKHQTWTVKTSNHHPTCKAQRPTNKLSSLSYSVAARCTRGTSNAVTPDTLKAVPTQVCARDAHLITDTGVLRENYRTKALDCEP
jgi:hypothetical protein